MVDVFVDTSAWYALRVANDAQHGAARRILERLALQQAGLHTTDWCLVETLALIARRVGKTDATAAAEWIYANAAVRIHGVTESLGEALDLYRTQAARVSLVDCGSFVVMRQLGISRAFAFDEDFSQAGFSVEAAD